jgi:hypothetical protein
MMINDIAVARHVNALMIDFGGRLNESVHLVSENCSAEELKLYRRAVGAVMAEMLTAIMNPLYRVHPSLKPPNLIERRLLTRAKHGGSGRQTAFCETAPTAEPPTPRYDP